MPYVKLSPHHTYIPLILYAFFSSSAGAATFAVTNLNDGGAGSLRQAVLGANAAGGSNAITFQNSLKGTITLTGGQITISNNLTLNGPGATVLAISGNRASRIFEIASGKTVNLDKLTLKDGYHPTHGGGIYNAGTLAITNSTLTNNKVEDTGDTGVGGAISNNSKLTITNSILSSNAARYGGCIDNGKNPPASLSITNSTLSNNSAYEGGCIYNSSELPVSITNSTFSGNTAERDGAGIYNAESAGALNVRGSVLFDNTAGGSGGGIYNRATLVVSNSTVSGNAATTHDGGGLWSGGNSQLTVSQTTVTDNAANISGGGIWLHGAQTTIGNSLVAGNSAPAGKEVRQDNSTAGGAFNSQGYNLFGENGVAGVDGVTLSAGDLILAGSARTAIGALANNGGSTLTHLPTTGSAVIDTGDNALIPAGVTTDQRGQKRIQNSIVDIGAVEVGAASGNTYNLSVLVTAWGDGTVTSNPDGITCTKGGTSCTETFPADTMVTLTAKPAAGYAFVGWAGCAPAEKNTCKVKMYGNRNVAATFASASYWLTVITKGSGSIVSDPKGINCKVTCGKRYPSNTVVTLTAIPASGYQFRGWTGGGCKGTGACTVTMDAAKHVAATFKKAN